MQNTLADLDALVASKLPLVFIESVEEGRLVNHLKAMAALRHEHFYLWTLADGLHNLTFKAVSYTHLTLPTIYSV